GTDINPLAHLVAEAKTMILTDSDFESIREWADVTLPKVKIRGRSRDEIDEWRDQGYQKDIPWRIRKIIKVILDKIPNLEAEKQRLFVRCALLKTGRWALDCKEGIPTVEQFRTTFYQDIINALTGAKELRSAIGPHKPNVICLNVPAESLS